jgi:hypothetical protein
MGRIVLFATFASFLAASGCAMDEAPAELTDETCSIDSFADLPIDALAPRQSPWLRYRYEGHPTSCWALTIWVQPHAWLDREAILAGAAYWGAEGMRFSLTEDPLSADIIIEADETVSCEDANRFASAKAGGRLGGIAITECGANLLDNRPQHYRNIIAHEIGHVFRAVHIPLDCDGDSPRMADGTPLCGDLALMNPSVFGGISFLTELDHLDFQRAIERNEETRPLFVRQTQCD